jgi:hypothetical membrane protein
MERFPHTRTLLAAGLISGPLYLLVGFAQAFLREGFDVRRHPLSMLSNGDLGWIQVCNFVITGLLVMAGAIGVRRALHPGRAGTWGPILFMVYGVGLIGAGLFAADPGNGFPPGAPAATGLSTHGLLHFVFGALGFYSLIAACFVFARRFAGLGRRGWLVYSIFTGVFFLASFMAIASGQQAPVFMLSLYAAVAWSSIWYALLNRSLRHEMA